MNSQFLHKALVAIISGAALLSATSGSGQTPSAPTLSYGAANVLKLAQAKVGEETIVAYVEKSGQAYGNLGASEIIYLRDQGISDRVLTTMLAQEKNARDAAIAQAIVQQPAVTTTQVVQPTTPVAVAPQPQVYYAPQPVTYVQAAPAPLIVMRDSSPRLADYGIYPRYGAFGCYPNYGYRSYNNCYPRATFSVGFSGRYGGIGFHSGGFRGGYCR